MKCGIYKIYNNKNGKFYIGSSKNIENRWKRHKIRLSRNYHPNQHLQASWNKYGESAFELNIIEECLEEKLLEREQYYINYTDCTNKKIGYNIISKTLMTNNWTGYETFSGVRVDFTCKNVI